MACNFLDKICIQNDFRKGLGQQLYFNIINNNGLGGKCKGQTKINTPEGDPIDCGSRWSEI